MQLLSADCFLKRILFENYEHISERFIIFQLHSIQNNSSSNKANRKRERGKNRILRRDEPSTPCLQRQESGPVASDQEDHPSLRVQVDSASACEKDRDRSRAVWSRIRLPISDRASDQESHSSLRVPVDSRSATDLTRSIHAADPWRDHE